MTDKPILRALDDVVDPCSASMGVPLGLVEMGLVRSVLIHEAPGGSTVRVVLGMSSPSCEYGPALAAAAQARLAQVPDVDRVEVTVDHTAEWSPTRLGASAQRTLGQRRALTLALSGARPFDWSSWPVEMPP